LQLAAGVTRRLGGTRQRRFAGTNLKPHKLPENAATPTTMAPALFAGDQVHAMLGVFLDYTLLFLILSHKDVIALGDSNS